VSRVVVTSVGNSILLLKQLNPIPHRPKPCSRQKSVQSTKPCKKDEAADVGKATVEVFQKSCPDSLPGIVFLSGGQSSVQATENLNACAKEATGAPWILSFSYGRALQEDALKAWGGDNAKSAAAQGAFLKRAKLNGLAQKGEYESAMEQEAMAGVA